LDGNGESTYMKQNETSSFIPIEECKKFKLPQLLENQDSISSLNMNKWTIHTVTEIPINDEKSGEVVSATKSSCYGVIPIIPLSDITISPMTRKIIIVENTRKFPKYTCGEFNRIVDLELNNVWIKYFWVDDVKYLNVAVENRNRVSFLKLTKFTTFGRAIISRLTATCQRDMENFRKLPENIVPKSKFRNINFLFLIKIF